ncbi:MAG TPA: hypothetical protein GXZ23_07285 [Clostridiales bacterium]|jgi:hypothetical protein|nr:hypothetical protein [Clostridiales bacterium]
MENQDFLYYKSRPIFRQDGMIYYGFPYNQYVVIISVMTTKAVGEKTIADKLSLQLFNTDPSVRPRERVKQNAVTFGLTSALDIADAWLTREDF